MTWKGFSKGLLFGAGMLAGVATGHLFYIERFPSGLAMFALTALFLFYAMVGPDGIPAGHSTQDDFPAVDSDLRRAVADLAVAVAENAVNGARNIGRTLPCSATELSKLEDLLNPILTNLNVSSAEKKRIAEELDRLRTRSRQTEGRRALSGNRF